MALEIEYPPGATPLDPDELAGLIPPMVATVGQLNAFESQNILNAIEWLASVRPKEVLDDLFLRELHRHMFDQTWQWAGTYRNSEKNLGVAPAQIGVSVRNLVDDFKAQVESGAAPIDELAARFHHRLVAIHPFSNGNGRHSRLAADLLLEQQGAKPFSWGSRDLASQGEARAAYIGALRAADARDTQPLLRFVRS